MTSIFDPCPFTDCPEQKITQKILFVQKIKIAIQTVAKVDAKLFCHKGRLDDGCNKNSKIIVVTKLQKFEKWSKIGTGSTLQIKYPKIIIILLKTL